MKVCIFVSRIGMLIIKSGMNNTPLNTHLGTQGLHFRLAECGVQSAVVKHEVLAS